MKKLMVFIVLFFSTTAYAGQAILIWEEPTLNEDGSIVTDLAGYKIYHGTASGTYVNIIDIGVIAGPKPTFTYLDLAEDEIHYFVVTAYDFAGNESVYSNEGLKKTLTIIRGTTLIVK